MKAVISVVDKVSGPMKGVVASLKAPAKAMQDVGAAAQNMRSRLGALGVGAIFGAGGVAAVAAGGKAVLGVSAQFEKFQTILETIEGSSEKAKASMDWISDFAAKTPYELAEVTDAFVKLKAYGINPMNGVLRSLGDAAAAGGKPLEALVEALADAQTGEYERLKEALQITADTNGDKVTLHFTDRLGQAMRGVVKKGDAAQMQKAMMKIISLKGFDGGMDKLSATWDGLWSNLMDSFARFGKMIGDAGYFNVMKDQLKDFLDMLNQWEQDGTLKRIATDISDLMVTAVTNLRAAFSGFDIKTAVRDLREFLFGYTRVSDLDPSQVESVPGAFERIGTAIKAMLPFLQPVIAHFTSVETVATRLAMVLALPVVAAIASVMTAFIQLAAVLAANPVIAAALLIAGAAALIYANWDQVAPWFERMWEAVKEIFGGFVVFVKGVFTGDFAAAMEGLKQIGQGLLNWFTGWGDAIGAIFTKVSDWIKSLFNIDIAGALRAQIAGLTSALPSWVTDKLGLTVEPAAAPTGPMAPAPSPALVASAQGQQLRGAVDININGAPPGTRVETRTQTAGVDLNTDVGYRSMALGY
ncbi:tape measure protein [Azospirillum tabaci]|uniref:tape measure protein n=1 Tax=Azospirillum tabaci TaxID=2752310 RepID=UPI0016604324|nr:tape measure protein [Azospirillum tabaci]